MPNWGFPSNLMLLKDILLIIDRPGYAYSMQTSRILSGLFDEVMTRLCGCLGSSLCCV